MLWSEPFRSYFVIICENKVAIYNQLIVLAQKTSNLDYVLRFVSIFQLELEIKFQLIK